MPNETDSDVRQKVRKFLQDRQRAYLTVFGKDNVAAQTVLEDLAKFCFENKSCFDPDARIHAVAEGRREVMLRVRHHLNMDLDELEAHYFRQEKSWAKDNKQAAK